MAKAAVDGNDKTSRKEPLLALAAFLIIALAVFAGVHQFTPPRAAPADVPSTEFSSGRAMKHLERIARAPHPVGSAEHALVRDFIIEEATAMGLTPEIQKTTSVREAPGFPLSAATVENIIVRLQGTDTSKAVLLMGHYDSVPTSPGASDDGSAVAVLLETIKAVKAGTPLKNDLIFLFTDAEEAGLLGAAAFIKEHPAAKEIGLALNFEARGNGGAAMMFETSADNGRLIRAFAGTAPRPVASSLSYELYKLLPNDTDLTVFKEAGIPGLNFAYIKGLDHYHTQLDSIEYVDERSLQHEGEYALALARHFGNLKLERMAEPDAIYFNIPGWIQIHYSSEWAVPIALFVLIAFVAVLASGFKKKRLTLRGIVTGFFAFFLSLIASALAATVAFNVVGLFAKGDSFALQGELYNSHYYFAGFAALTVAVCSALYALFGKRASVRDLSAGALIWWAILATATSFYLPGGSYLFAWPLLFGVAGLAFTIYSTRDETALKKIAAVCVSAIPGILLLVPIIYMVFLAMTLDMAAALASLTVLLTGLLIPLFSLTGHYKKWLLPAGAFFVCAGFIVSGSLISGEGDEWRQPNSIFYAASADSGQAVWASYDQEPDEWTAQFLNADTETGSLDGYITSSYGGFMKAKAAPAELAPPRVELLGETRSGDARILRLRVTSNRRAPVITIAADKDVEVLVCEIDGKRIVHESNRRWLLRYYALPEEGIEVTLEVKSPGAVKIKATDESYGLPELPTNPLKPRPSYMMASVLPYSDSTLVSKSFAF